jgi:hypothetical protein
MADNLVVEIAKMIDAEGAYSVWYSGTDPNAEPKPHTTRQLYFQADYELKAIAILKRLRSLTSDEIGEALVQHEIAGWRRLKIPIEQLGDEGEQIVRRKYFPASLSENEKGET